MSSIHRAIGIDLGTTNSVMARIVKGEPRIIPNALGSSLTPSAISVDRRNELLVGKPAKNRPYDENTILSIKRFMGLPFHHTDVQEDIKRVFYKVSEGAGQEVRVHMQGRTYSPVEISAMILHRLRQDAQASLGEPVGRAVITVPAYFGDAQVAATRDAGRMAGFTVMRILREPTAAALAFGLDRVNDESGTSTVMVYDLGGGTFDISILMMTQGVFAVMGIEGDKHLGGDDFDNAIMDHIFQTATGRPDIAADLRARAPLKFKAEESKIELSAANAVDITIPALAGVNIETDLTRPQFNALIKQRVDRTLELMHKAMHECHMTPDLIDHILLVGGSILIPYVQERLVQEFNPSKIRRNVDPMHCVALGAAIQTTLIEEIECPNPECHDVTGQPTKNPIEAAQCARCHTSLIGIDVVTCPTCFVPTDTSQPACRKCKSPLHPPSTDRPSSTPATSPQYWKCQECEHPKNPLASQKCGVCGQPRESGGINCPRCGNINRPGARQCVHCQELLGELSDVIPEGIVIELQDSSSAVLIPKNTGYPTPTPFTALFRTPEANLKQLEVVVRQGSATNAADNEYCGVVLFDLPPDTPKAARVNISLGLDEDGAVITTVQLVDFPDRRITARILRGGISDPKVRQRREHLVQQAEALINQGQGLAEAEALSENARQVGERGYNLTPEDLDSLEQEIAQLQEKVDAHQGVQRTLNEAEMIQATARDYLPPKDLAELEQRINTVKQAQARGQHEPAKQHTQELQQFLEQRSVYRLLGILEAARRSGKLSAGLSNRIGAGLNALKAARNEAEAERIFAQLTDCFQAIEQEFRNISEVIPVIGKPTL